MSHFAGFVILTPEYAKKHDIEDALAPYYEGLDVPEYSKGEVSDFEKIEFIIYYLKLNQDEIYEKIYLQFLVEGLVDACSVLEEDKIRYIYKCFLNNKEDFSRIFKLLYPKEFDKFESLYVKHGKDWNGNGWRISHISGKWEEYSTYNPNSKWDWYDTTGRWSNCIKTKSGEYVNECLLEELDLSPYKDTDFKKRKEKDWRGELVRVLKKNVRWRFTENGLPFYLVIDGVWYEKGEGGWFGMAANEMSEEEWTKKFMELISKLPPNSEVYNIDFHI